MSTREDVLTRQYSEIQKKREEKKSPKYKSKADEQKKKSMCKRKSQSAQKKGTPREER